MAVRYEQYKLKRGDNLGDPAFWNPRLADIDRRMHARELDSERLDASVDQIEALALARLNDTLSPIIEEALTRLASVGAVFAAESLSEATIGAGVKNFVLTEGTRASFVATDYVSVRPVGVPAVSFVASVTSYERAAGLLIVEPVVGFIVGAGTYAAWSIHVAPPPELGVYTTEQTDAAIVAAVLALRAGVGTALDTLDELAAALGDDANFAATVTAALASKVPITRSVNGHGLNTDITVSKGDVGLGNADNTSDVNKPISTAQAAGLVPIARSINGHGLNTDVTVSKADVGLGNADNTSDASKPISTAQAAGLVPVARSVNGHGLNTDVTVSKGDVGLGNADNTSDANKPVSIAQSAAIDTKSPLAALAAIGLQLNSGMSISQELGTTPVVMTGTNAGYILDGWAASWAGTFTASAFQSADVPPSGGYTNSIKIIVSAGQGSLGANDHLMLYHPVEGIRSAALALGNANARTMTVCFWVAAHRTGTYSGAIRNGAANRSYPFTFNINAPDTFEWKSIQIPGDVTGTWAIDATACLILSIMIAGGTSKVGTQWAWAGANYIGASASTNGVAAATDIFWITGVHILPGAVTVAAADASLLARPRAPELLLCQRHLYRRPSYSASDGFEIGQVYAAGGAILSHRFPIEMRANPTLTVSSGADFSGLNAAAAALNAFTTFTASATTPRNCQALLSGGSGLVAGNAALIKFNSATAWLQADARL